MNTIAPTAHRQRGVVLIYTLIVLVILTIGAVALVRSMNTSLFSAGNLAFRRDLVNQGEQAISKVLQQFQAGGALVGATTADLQTQNYKATMLVTNGQGIPAALLDDAQFLAVGTVANDLNGATFDVKIRYVIDRLCNATGPSSSVQCVQANSYPPGGTVHSLQSATPPSGTVYRATVRVSGARGTQVFLQTTFTKPD